MAHKDNIVISLEELRSLQIRLTQLDRGWIKLLTDKIKESARANNEIKFINVTATKIYNVIYGKVVDHAWRTKVFQCGHELRKELERKILEVRKIAI